MNVTDNDARELGASNLSRRKEDLQDHLKSAAELEEIMGLEGITSGNPDAAAKAVAAFDAGRRRIAECLGKPVDEAELAAKTAEFAQMVAELHQKEQPTTSMWGPETKWRLTGNIESWDDATTQKFMSSWPQLGTRPVGVVGAPTAPPAPKP